MKRVTTLRPGLLLYKKVSTALVVKTGNAITRVSNLREEDRFKSPAAWLRKLVGAV